MLTPDNIPAHFFPLPEGHVLLGQGSHIPNAGRATCYAINSEEEGDGWDSWQEANGFLLTEDDGLCYAVPIDHPLVDANRELVESFNPDVIFPWMTPVATWTPERELPEGLPPVPEGHVLLGWGRLEFAGYPDERGYLLYGLGRDGRPIYWVGPSTWGVSDQDHCFAYPEDGVLARAFPRIVAYYRNLLSTQPTVEAPPTVQTVSAIPLEPWMPPLPEGHVYVGRGGSFAAPRNFRGWSIHVASRTEWHYEDDWNGRAIDRFYAVPLDSEVLDFNPHLRPCAAPDPVEASPEPMTFGKRQWVLTLNGAPVASLSELENLCSHLISKPEHLTPLTECLWKALEYDDPESRIEEWASKEALLLMVDFIPDRSEADVLIPTIAESSKSIGEIITTAAAGVLLRGGLSNHFNYTEEGRLIINPANPPNLEQGCEILRRTLEVRETGQKLDNYSAWTLGMLGDELERFFGDAFDPSLVMEATGRCYNTYITSLKVYRELWANRRNLSFTHHKEALYAKVPIDDTHFILDTADRLKLSVAQQRKLVSFVRLYGRASFEEDPPQDADLLMERLDVKSVNKNFLFFLRSENKWFRYRGPFEHIPNGASPIINADTRAILDTTGNPTEMTEWTPVGIEVPHLRGRAAVHEAERVAEAETERDATEAPLTHVMVDGADEPLDIGQVLSDNEEVLTEAFRDIVARPINPFTGESLESTQEAADAQDPIEEEVA